MENTLEIPDLHALRQPGHSYHWSCYFFFKTKEQEAFLLGLWISAIITLGNVNSYVHHSWFLTLWGQFFWRCSQKIYLLYQFFVSINFSCQIHVGFSALALENQWWKPQWLYPFWEIWMEVSLQNKWVYCKCTYELRPPTGVHYCVLDPRWWP